MPSAWYEQTGKRSYPSKYSPGKFVTGAQYVIELLCERKAGLENKTLPIRFWRLDEWKKEFSAQTRCVNNLLKKYDVKTLVHVLHDNPRIYSLRPAWVKPKLEHAQKLVNNSKKLMAEQLRKQTEVNRNTLNSRPRQRVIRKNALSQLYELDEIENGEKTEES